MKFIYLFIALLTCATLAEATHYRVYLIGGQSNGNGRGDTAELSTAPLSTENVASPQTNIRFYWRKTQVTTNGNLTQDTWIDLQPGSGHGGNNPAAHPSEFGPELTFGRDMAAADPSVNIAIIKYTHGGTNLQSRWAETGVNYLTFVEVVNDALAALTANGDTYEVGGMLWVQGENDTNNSTASGNYEMNLTNLVSRLREDTFGGPDEASYTMPIVISGISNSQYTNITTTGSGSYLVRQAQETVAATPGLQSAFVNTDGLPVYSNGVLHFTATAQIAIGEGCATAMLSLENNDIDRDGLLLDEELTLGTNANLPDSDGDSQQDGFETVAGTDPLSASSFYKITDHEVTTTQFNMAWPSLPGNQYQVEVSNDLQNWEILNSNVSAAAAPESTTNFSAALSEVGALIGESAVENSAFFRVKIIL